MSGRRYLTDAEYERLTAKAELADLWARALRAAFSVFPDVLKTAERKWLAQYDAIGKVATDR